MRVTVNVDDKIMLSFSCRPRSFDGGYKMNMRPALAMFVVSLLALGIGTAQAQSKAAGPSGRLQNKPVAEEQAEQRAAEPLRAIEARLDRLVHESYPGALVRIEDGAVVARYHTRRFLVYAASKTGKFVDKPHEEVGPDYDGFMLTIRLHQGPAVAQAVSGQEYREPYWTTHLETWEAQKDQRYLSLNFCYGSRVPSSLLGRIQAIVRDTIEKPGGGR